jgi:hypothetical protein
MGRRRAWRQGEFRFRARAERLERRFKLGIVGLTALAIVGMVAGTRTGRYAAASAAVRARMAAARAVGMPIPREDVDKQVRLSRERSIEQTRTTLARFYRETDPNMQRLFRAAAMDPAHALVASGRATESFVLSSEVFAPDDHGRSYRLRPGRRSVWITHITLHKGPFGLFIVPDTPEVRAAAAGAGGIVDDPSVQTTNSWGLRGPEPDTGAGLRGLVLGDSFMQGVFVGDDETPPVQLERELKALRGGDVSVLNTGHLGYAPEQYFATLQEYGPRFRPHFVVISVCPNDLINGPADAGYGDEWEEARYWLGRIYQWCRTNMAAYLLVPVPWEPAVSNSRKLGLYARPVYDLLEGGSNVYLDPTDRFVDEHLRLVRDGRPGGAMSALYNARVGDGHFSPAGSALWARLVADRLDLILRVPREGKAAR